MSKIFQLTMTDFYQKNFQEYHHRTFSIDPSSFLSPLAKRLAPGSRILDVGCGSGRDMLWFKERGFRPTGFERSPGLTELARKNTRCDVKEGDFESYDFSQFSFDAIVLAGSLVHVSHEKMERVFTKIIQGLCPHGWILLTLKQGTGTRSDSHGRVFYLWQDKALREFFTNKGFHIAEVFQQPSAVGTGEIWLGYVLQNKQHKISE